MDQTAALEYEPLDLASDTVRPPPPRGWREETQRKETLKRAAARMGDRVAKPKSFPVTVRCETEEQRAMLVDYLAEMGFEVEGH